MDSPPSAVGARSSPCGLGARCDGTLSFLADVLACSFGYLSCLFGSLPHAARLVVLVHAAAARRCFLLTFWLIASAICFSTSARCCSPLALWSWCALPRQAGTFSGRRWRWLWSVALPLRLVAARRSPCDHGARCDGTLSFLADVLACSFGHLSCHFGSLLLAARLVVMVRAAAARCHF